MKVYIAYLTIIPLILSIFLPQPGIINTKDGAYSISIFKSKNSSHEPVIYGTILEQGTKSNVLGPMIRLNNNSRFKADLKTGKYSFKLKPGTYSFTGQGMGYYWPVTKFVRVSKGDSIKIDFYLKVDNTPTID